MTSGFVARDLVKLCQKAFVTSLARDATQGLVMEDLLASLEVTQPSQMKGVSAAAEIESSASWDDFAG